MLESKIAFANIHKEKDEKAQPVFLIVVPGSFGT